MGRRLGSKNGVHTTKINFYGKRGRPKLWKNMNKKEKVGRVWRYVRLILIIIVTLIAFALVFMYFTGKNDTESVSTTTPQNTSKPISKASATKTITNEVIELKDAAQDYQNDGDQEKLTNRLESVQKQNQNLETRLPEGHTKEAVQTVNNTVSQIQQNPNNANNIVQNNLNDLVSKSGFWASIYYQVQSWVNNFQ